MRTERDILEAKEKLEKEISMLDELMKFKRDLEAKEAHGWECTGIYREHGKNSWKFTYRRKYSLCGKEITEEDSWGISFV